MTRPLSNNLREPVAAAARFGVAVSAVLTWSRNYRATGSVARSKMGEYRNGLLEPHRLYHGGDRWPPHLTLYGLKDEPARGVKVSHNAVQIFLRRDGLRFKNCSSPWSRTARM